MLQVQVTITQKKVCYDLQIQNSSGNHDLYLKSDTLLDIFDFS